jgi:hypothetical protein
MPFVVRPILEQMLSLYGMPAGMERFRQYLEILEGGKKGELSVPIGAFNPMGKSHVNKKITVLMSFDAEKIAAEALEEVNSHQENFKDRIEVVLNLSDDLKGAWTNTFTSDFDHKFTISALVKRNFCVPVFKTSEHFSEELIRDRTLEAAYRHLYWCNHGPPVTLEDHLLQERFVAMNGGHIFPGLTKNELFTLEAFFKKHRTAREYHIIFNFFYGDQASASLVFPVCGTVMPFGGFRFAAHQASAFKTDHAEK